MILGMQMTGRSKPRDPVESGTQGKKLNIPASELSIVAPE
jgi:hypothetical protein